MGPNRKKPSWIQSLLQRNKFNTRILYMDRFFIWFECNTIFICAFDQKSGLQNLGSKVRVEIKPNKYLLPTRLSKKFETLHIRSELFKYWEYPIWTYSNFEFQYLIWSDSNFEYFQISRIYSDFLFDQCISVLALPKIWQKNLKV